jgi:hypothetical protein
MTGQMGDLANAVFRARIGRLQKRRAIPPISGIRSIVGRGVRERLELGGYQVITAA